MLAKQFLLRSAEKKTNNNKNMYILQTPNHTFDVVRKKSGTNQYYYTIRNLVDFSRVCMDIIVWKNDEQWWASIEYIEYDSLEKKTGTIEMVQGMLTALLKKHSKISTIELNDKSFFTIRNNDRIPLPEYRMITKGKTWYQEYFKAIPASSSLTQKIHQYKERKKLTETLASISKLTSNSFKEFLRRNDLKQLSGNLWYIPDKDVKTYTVQGHLYKDNEKKQGGNLVWTKRNEFDFCLYRSENLCTRRTFPL
jgi:hypothetical protein